MENILKIMIKLVLLKALSVLKRKCLIEPINAKQNRVLDQCKAHIKKKNNNKLNFLLMDNTTIKLS